MKHILHCIISISILFFVGCDKVHVKDEADYFVGTYDLYVTTEWNWIGYDKTDINMDKEYIEITKISSDKVRIRGGINIIDATAVVNDKTLFIEDSWNDEATFTPSKWVMDGVFEFSETYLMESDPPCLTTKYYTAIKR